MIVVEKNSRIKVITDSITLVDFVVIAVPIIKVNFIK